MSLFLNFALQDEPLSPNIPADFTHGENIILNITKYL